MSMGPAFMPVDDIVVILLGGKMPYILRPSPASGGYFIVGLCYVYGLMHGEAVEELRDRGDLNRRTEALTGVSVSMLDVVRVEHS